jgi:hypothetical protein
VIPTSNPEGQGITMKRLFTLLLITSLAALISAASYKTSAYQQDISFNNQVTTIASDHFSPSIESEAGKFILYQNDGGVGCRQATREEADSLSHPDPDEGSRHILLTRPYGLKPEKAGLQIQLRATQQMEGFPEAKAAFIRAAAIWQDTIQTPITVVIDVDFGPTRFGEKFGPQILGWTVPQDLSSDIYPAVRAQLIAGAANEQEREIFNSLPVGTVPTDIGNTTIIRAPAANGRALGLLDPVADPEGREKNLGRPPSIGFNSAAGFDFDPSNGIDPNKVDFEAVVVHEIGHVLGFISNTTYKQEDNKVPIALSVWDLFRIRQGTRPDAFSTAKRILTAGGEQSFSVAGLQQPLSTGASNLGGDGRGPWHWKDDDFTDDNRYIGIMDPTLPPGRRQVISAYDLLAMKMMGYKLKSGIEIAPEIGDLSGKMQGDMLAITGLAVIIDSDVIEAQMKVLDERGNVIAEYPLATLDPGEVSIADFALGFPGINQWRAATHASLTLLNSHGNRSATLTTGILKGDSSGPTLTSLSFDGSVLKIKGKRLSGQLSLEVNGEVVVLSNASIKGAGKKVQVEATAADLQLTSGPNRVRVIGNGLRSNAMVLNID